MAEIPLLKEEKMKFEGVFDFKNLYRELHTGMERDGWDVKEKRYVEKVKPGVEDKHIEIEWEVKLPIDNYTLARVDLFFELKDLVKINIEKRGVPVTVYKGIVEVKFSYTLIPDYEDKWAKDPLLKHVKRFYEKRIYRRTLDLLKEEHWKNGWDYLKEMKELLGALVIHEVAPSHEIPLREE